jgi:peptide-methionine (S)-S-oxide reductase
MKMRIIAVPVLLIAAFLLIGAGGLGSGADDVAYESTEKESKMDTGTELATLGGGCFWCLEAVFERIDGVISVTSGYAGGIVPDPSYKEVCSGGTGHAEVVQIEYDPKKIGFEGLLDVFWKAHDPTTLDRQGADVGTQYRSTILYHDDEQKAVAERSLKKAQDLYGDRIVTEIQPLEQFYAAEEYHQDYFEKNPNAGYCRIVIEPKLKKLDLL